MKKSLLNGLIAFSMTFSAAVLACDIHGKSGFMPENNLNIGVDDKMAGDMTETRFNEIIKRVYTTYAPIVRAKGATLQMNNKWTDGTVNASADRKDGIWTVNMYGGLARHPYATEDGFMMVVCHELGHHLGGAPRYDQNGDWAATEGQADYFAGLKCMRRVLGGDDNVAIVAKMQIDAEATKKCEMVFKSQGEVALCQRIAMAGKSLGSLLGAVVGNTTKLSFDTPDTRTQKQTTEGHPRAQCRLDTYFQGGLCDKSVDENVSEDSPIPGTCIKRDGYTLGVRPRCWYAPSAAEL